ncbi:MAG: hypothetical protein QM645_10080 [Asticcacaulis sp.]
MKIGATSWLIIRGVALIATGFLAATGMTLFCLIRNYLDKDYESYFVFLRRYPDELHLALFIAMVVWLLLAFKFAWSNRSPTGITLSIIAFFIFAASARNVLLNAYPVCNSF